MNQMCDGCFLSQDVSSETVMLSCKRCGRPTAAAPDCTCERLVPVIPSPEAVTAWCLDCHGWLKRPSEDQLRRIADRKSRKRRAYMLAGLTGEGNSRRRGSGAAIGHKPAGQRGSKRAPWTPDTTEPANEALRADSLVGATRA